MAEVLELDGSEGEGGGQILRTALSLSLVTGRPFRLVRVRAGRTSPGLRPQHLACLRGAADLCGGEVAGAAVGSAVVEFHPGPVRPGAWLFDVGTAGSAPLLLQCLAYPVAIAGGGRLTLRGGTHVPASPSFHSLAEVWAELLPRLGFAVRLALGAAGFYPEGGGEISAEVEPIGASQAPSWLSRGKLEGVTILSCVGNLPFHIAERQGDAAAARLRRLGIHADVQRHAMPCHRSRGSAVLVRASFEHSVAGFQALGQRGKPAEVVGREAADALAAFLETDGAIDEHLSDQLLVPAALAAAGRAGPRRSLAFTAAAVTPHLTTNARVIERLLDVPVRVDGRVVTVG